MAGAGHVAGVAGISALVIFLVRWILKNRPRTIVKDKVVLITGASSGLGEACAHVFYKAGAKVILSARREKELQRVKSDLMQLQNCSNSHEPKVLILDLSDLTNIPSKAAEACGIYGNIDILVNNGGISYRGDTMDTTLDVDQKVMMVNYFGHVALTKALLPSMINARTGHIVAVSSIQGKIAIPFRSAYAASKHAMQAFFDCLRAEVSDKNIHVSIISPGYIKTNLSLNAVTGDGSAYGVMDSTTESGASPEQIADCVMRAVRCHHDEVIPAAFTHRLVVLLRNVIPGLFFWIMSKRALKYKRQQQKTR